jgi:hypothetical protein
MSNRRKDIRTCSEDTKRLSKPFNSNKNKCEEVHQSHSSSHSKCRNQHERRDSSLTLEKLKGVEDLKKAMTQIDKEKKQR